jgi:hypothetical protein
VPTHIEQAPLPSEPLSCYLARRAEELNLPPEQPRAQLPGVVAFGRFSFQEGEVLEGAFRLNDARAVASAAPLSRN